MSHVQLVIPKWSLPMPWVQQMADVFKAAGHRFTISPSIHESPDVVIFGWCNAETVAEINRKPKTARYIVFMRRYEIYQKGWESLDWVNVDELIFVNEAFKNAAQAVIKNGPKMRVLYNGVDVEKWSFRGLDPRGKNIALVGYLNHRKNLPLALQIMAKLPRDYSLHIAGDVQEGDVFSYIDNMAKNLGVRVYWNGAIPHGAMDRWLDDKNYILCTSTSEGNPNNVIEAMAKGIKPVVHNWPGAEQQFPAGVIFNTIDEAVKIIKEETYNAAGYRELVREKFSKDNYSKTLLGIVEGLCVTSA